MNRKGKVLFLFEIVASILLFEVSIQLSIYRKRIKEYNWLHNYDLSLSLYTSVQNSRCNSTRNITINAGFPDEWKYRRPCYTFSFNFWVGDKLRFKSLEKCTNPFLKWESKFMASNFQFELSQVFFDTPTCTVTSIILSIYVLKSGISQNETQYKNSWVFTT